MGKYRLWIFASLAFLLPLALYVKTLSPTYIPVDSAEFALCMHFWGVCHPPGFPLYVFLGKIFTDFFPFGTIIYKANLISAIFGAGTILLVYLCLIRLKVKGILALCIALILAVSAAFWEYSVAADVFTFATFFLALTFFLVFAKRFYLASFVLGLSASHFYISAVLWPLVVWYGLQYRSNKSYGSYWSYKNIAAVFLLPALCFALGFFPQILMYFRMQQEPIINWGHALGIGGFIDFVRRKEFGNIFLIANPVLTFSLFKFFKHIWAFLINFLTSFAFILPILALLGAFLGQFRQKNYVFLGGIFLIILFVQLFLLSTIDPLDKSSPFQINKFYLSAYVPAVLLIGMGVQKAVDRLFENNLTYPVLLLAVLLVIYLFSNYKANSLAGNYFSQNMVLDAMDQLPEGSTALVVSHVFNFGARYEQLVNGRYKTISVLYFPNEKNRDSESYFGEIFSGNVNGEFYDRVSGGKNINGAQTYVLSTISKNLNRRIFILQGGFEEGFFSYLKPYIRPYGLWWEVQPDLLEVYDVKRAQDFFENLRNASLKYESLAHVQQRQDALNYAVSYHSTGIALASADQYDGAIAFLNKSYEIRPQGENIQKEIELIKQTKELDSGIIQLKDSRNVDGLEKLANDFLILGNAVRCSDVYAFLIGINGKKAEYFSNLASCLKLAGKFSEAKEDYQKALEIDPTLESAKNGLAAMGE